jgi:hypothetical protein
LSCFSPSFLWREQRCDWIRVCKMDLLRQKHELCFDHIHSLQQRKIHELTIRINSKMEYETLSSTSRRFSRVAQYGEWSIPCAIKPWTELISRKWCRNNKVCPSMYRFMICVSIWITCGQQGSATGWARIRSSVKRRSLEIELIQCALTRSKMTTPSSSSFDWLI